MRDQQQDYQNVELQVYSMLSRRNVTENRIVEQNQKSRRDNCEKLPYHRTTEQEIISALANKLNITNTTGKNAIRVIVDTLFKELENVYGLE